MSSEETKQEEILLSIDIGKKNLGYCLYGHDVFEFGILNITAYLKQHKLKENLHNRNLIIVKYIDELRKAFNIKTVVVEQQIMHNVVAMCLQSCLSCYCVCNKLEYVQFHAASKFTFTGDKYNSKTKEHKQLAINYAKRIISKLNPKKLETFAQYRKQDDIGDAICMALISSDYDKGELKCLMRGE